MPKTYCGTRAFGITKHQKVGAVVGKRRKIWERGHLALKFLPVKVRRSKEKPLKSFDLSGFCGAASQI